MSARPVQINISRYIVGAEISWPFCVVLTINTRHVDVDQFRADLPRIAGRLEAYITEARETALEARD